MSNTLADGNDLATPTDFEKIADALAISPDHMVISRFVPVDSYSEDDGSTKRNLLVLDVETTGLDSEVDKVFELGLVLVQFSPKTGKIFQIIERYSGFEDPGVSLSDQTTKLTGVTTEMVANTKFDHEKILSLISQADLVLAQNAGFDRKFVEKIWPEFIVKNWACSMAQGPWEEMGIPIRKQEYLAMVVARVFYGAHRALIDAEVLLKIIASNAHDGQTILSHILAAARSTSYRVWADNAPFEKKDILKNGGKFNWSDGTEPGKLKAWYKDGVASTQETLDFMAEYVYGRRAAITVDTFNAKDRFSIRCTERTTIMLNPKPKN